MGNGRFEGKAVFLSGPMTGAPGLNLGAFDAAAAELRRRGAARVFNPADVARRMGAGRPHAEYMTVTLHELTDHERGCGRPAYGAVAMLPGWEASEGARAERMVAEACGIEVVELGDAL